ncbi:MAG: SDR family NAD(P)-dependent oxidoreductase [Vicinamibacterales bacterium]
MDLHLSDKVALVTGSSRGLGFASARALAREGCRVTLTGRDSARLETARDALAAESNANDRLLAMSGDMSTEDGIGRAIDRTVSTFGGLDILVNNMGLARGAGIEDTSDAEWQAAYDQTLAPGIRASRLAVPHLRRRGGGVIIMIASIWGRESGGRMTYNAMKAAQISLGKALSQQLARDRIRVLSVAPGSILFPGGSWWKRQQEDPGGIEQFIERELPFGRFGHDHEVGDVVAFLASPRASWITGASIPVDGGQSRSNI